MDIIKRLQKISLFNAIREDQNALEKIAAIIQVERFPKGTYIIKEGETGDRMYILNAGSVKIEKKTLAKENFPVANLTDEMNIFFGHLALADNDVRSASVYTVTNTECYVIRKNDFEKLCDDNHNIGYFIFKEIAKALSMDLRKTTQEKMNLIQALVSNDND